METFAFHLQVILPAPYSYGNPIAGLAVAASAVKYFQSIVHSSDAHGISSRLSVLLQCGKEASTLSRLVLAPKLLRPQRLPRPASRMIHGEPSPTSTMSISLNMTTKSGRRSFWTAQFTSMPKRRSFKSLVFATQAVQAAMVLWTETMI